MKPEKSKISSTQKFKVTFVHDKTIFFIQFFLYDLVCVSIVPENRLEHPGTLASALYLPWYFFCRNYPLDPPELLRSSVQSSLFSARWLHKTPGSGQKAKKSTIWGFTGNALTFLFFGVMSSYFQTLRVWC